MEHVTNQKQVERQILALVKTYNVLYKKADLCFFCSRWKREICRKSTAHVIERTFDLYKRKSQKRYPNMKMPISCGKKAH